MNIIVDIAKAAEDIFKTVSSNEKGLELFDEALSNTKNEFPKGNIEEHIKEIFKK